MYHKKLFRFAALWNIGLAGSIALFPEPLLSLFQMPNGLSSPLFVYELIAVIITFGIGYLWASNDFEKNAPIIKLGALGKTLVFFTGLYWTVEGECSLPMMVLFVGDLIFAILFVLALNQLRSKLVKEPSF